jgi:rhamnose transport system substrate-binding protein
MARHTVMRLLGLNAENLAKLGRAISSGKIKCQPGDKFTAGKLGEYTIDKDGVILLGPPTVFSKDNIDKFDF